MSLLSAFGPTRQSEEVRPGGDCLLKALIPGAYMRCRLLPQRLKGAPGSLIQETSLFKTAVLFEQCKQAVQRILVRGETHQVLFQHFFRQAVLPMLEIEIGQVANHAATSQAQRLLPRFDPAVLR